MKKIAVIFPGIGYHADKPLLYYAAKIAAADGYEIIRITYPDYPVNLKDADASQLKEFLGMGLKSAGEALKDLDPGSEDEILFISKSIGTVVATAYASSRRMGVRHILFTPLIQTFTYAGTGCGIAFNGTRDAWADCEKVRSSCRDLSIPIMTIAGGNHSLETGNVTEDLNNMRDIMKSVETFITGRDDSIYSIPVKGQDGIISDLREYTDRVLLIVNTATGCGFTPQYEFLERIYRKYGKDGFVILDFPCNQFGKQAPGSNKDIQSFCTSRYDTTFPRFAKIEVNGDGEEELYKFLKEKQGFKGFGEATKEAKYMAAKLATESPGYEDNDDIKWNFTKFLIDRKGNVVARFEATDSLDELEERIVALL